MKQITLGIDLLSGALRRRKLKLKRKPRVAILCHPSSVDRQHRHLESIIEESAELVALFGPQHGIHGETQDNMIEWQDTLDSKGRPVYSLYGERRRPTLDSLKGVDVVVIDLFDVGARYYTFIYTMLYMLEVCGELGVSVIVCDRPNPLGGQLIEGPILDMNYKSFVGMFPLTVCHGMTIGELAQFFNFSLKQKPPLEVLKMRGWKRSMHWPETGVAWTLPSPNMPAYTTSLLYPGLCLLEATTLSEGRGTTRPFELIGAPFFDWDKIQSEYFKEAKRLKLPPVVFHRQGFMPTFHKFSTQLCRGALQFVPKPKGFLPLRHMTLLLWVFRKLYQKQWDWKSPPYEYEFDKLPIDILAGGPALRQAVDSQSDLKALFGSWTADEAIFKRQRRAHLLY